MHQLNPVIAVAAFNAGKALRLSHAFLSESIVCNVIIAIAAQNGNDLCGVKRIAAEGVVAIGSAHKGTRNLRLWLRGRRFRFRLADRSLVHICDLDDIVITAHRKHQPEAKKPHQKRNFHRQSLKTKLYTTISSVVKYRLESKLYRTAPVTYHVSGNNDRAVPRMFPCCVRSVTELQSRAS